MLHESNGIEKQVTNQIKTIQQIAHVSIYVNNIDHTS